MYVAIQQNNLYAPRAVSECTRFNNARVVNLFNNEMINYGQHGSVD